jgi:REP element-mobilizing transposase RayT
MGNPLRTKDPSLYRLITIRTVRAEMWLMPTPKNAKLIGGILARYQELLGIELYAYTVLSNHIHLLLRAPRGNSDEFAENINREIARRMNWKYHREGPLWGRRYSEQVVLDDEDDLLEAFLYVTLNPTRHGLVKDASNWRGLNSFHHSLRDLTPRPFHFTHYSRKNEEGIPLKTTHSLTLTPLPQFQEMSAKARGRKVKSLLYSRLREYWEKRGDTPYLSTELIEQQLPGDTPKRVSRSPRPHCYTKCAHRLREYLQERRLLIARYAEASFQFRLGKLDTQFPAFTFKPPLQRAPRRAPFRPVASVICA